jgi:hypothetical protein
MRIGFIAAVLTLVIFGGYWWLVHDGWPVQAHPQQRVLAPIEKVPWHSPTFVDSLTIHTYCDSSWQGYLIVAVDGKKVAFINGTHRWTYWKAGRHKFSFWGSCSALVTSG